MQHQKERQRRKVEIESKAEAEAIKARIIDEWLKHKEAQAARDTAGDKSTDAGKHRLPFQRNGSNYQKLQNTMPKSVCDAIDQRQFPGPKTWGSDGAPLVLGPLKRSGGRFLEVDNVTIGAEKSSEIPVGFLGSLGSRLHRFDAWEFAASLRAPFAPDLCASNWLLACPARRSHGAGSVQIRVYRTSTGSRKARKRAHDHPDAVHLVETGQGKGVCGFQQLLLPACTARAQGFKVDVIVDGSSDRLLRSGSWVAWEALRCAGISLDVDEGERCDEPYVDGQRTLFETHRSGAEKLERRLIKFVTRRWRDETTPDLAVKDLNLPGLNETFAVGSGLDWITREEAITLGIDRRILARFVDHRSWRGFLRSGGSWLVRAGFRERMSIPSTLRPVLLEHHEETIMKIIKLRFPSAKLLDPIVIWPCHCDAGLSERNARELAKYKGEQLIAIDHASVHWGSVLDLDLMLRQRSSALRTILCSSYAAPGLVLTVLREAAMIFDRCLEIPQAA